MILKKSTYLVIFLLYTINFCNCVYAGFGTSPSLIKEHHLTRGSQYEKSFVLSRSNPNDAMRISVSVEGSIKKWVTVEPNTAFIAPAGQERIPVKIQIKIPHNAKNDVYQGGIRFSLEALDLNSAPAGVVPQLSTYVPIDLQVTGDQLLNYEVGFMKIEPVPIGEPLGVVLGITNTGNVDAQLEKITLEVFNASKNTLLFTKDITDIMAVPPFKSSNLKLGIPIDPPLSLGEYWSTISVYKNGELLKKQNIPFKVIDIQRHKSTHVAYGSHIFILGLLFTSYLILRDTCKISINRSGLKTALSLLLLLGYILFPRERILANSAQSLVTVLSIPSPTNLVISGSSTKWVKLTWDSVEEAVSYNIYKNGVLVTNIGATTYTDSSIRKNTSYTYAVTALSSFGGESLQSNQVTKAAKSSIQKKSEDSQTNTLTEETVSLPNAVNSSAISQEVVESAEEPNQEIPANKSSLFDVGISPAMKGATSKNIIWIPLVFIPGLLGYFLTIFFIRKGKYLSSIILKR